MLISYAQSLVLFATPKTGSTALEYALAPSCDVRLTGAPARRHTNMRTYEARMEPKVRALCPEEPDLVALVREPLDWLGSWYRYRARPGMKAPQNSTRGMSFEEFIAGYLSDTPPQPSRLGSQTDFMARADGSCGVTALFPYERFDEAAAYLRRKLETVAEPDAVNVSPVAELALSPELEARLREERTADFALHQQALAGWDALAARIGL
ncbi:gamma-glutamyl kinase [Frigidibacter sp.]|uniref:gamma-glutamyl kinase n=1 Tax=Frigidibacter sp. TaxID=2586418 RepID=UPI0027352FB5|nr:gamma-glutamyl kinase [Frigidibacter sp.]MDP3338815.1 gamma-glutamyl kinase [Frigidibacter sp.]